MIDGDISPPSPGFFKDIPYSLHSTHNLYILRSRRHLFSYVTLKIYTRLCNPKIPRWHEATYAIRGWKSCQHSGKNILLKLKTLQKELSHSFAVKVVWACYPLLCLWMVSGTHPLPPTASDSRTPPNKNCLGSIGLTFLTWVYLVTLNTN